MTTATATEVRCQSARVAVLPVGSFEQHGSFLPLITDTVVASLIAARISSDHAMYLLPPITMSCSHEHAGIGPAVSVSASTLIATITDIRTSLAAADVQCLVLVNGHGGNYVLSNITQEANVVERRVALFPSRDDWDVARTTAGLETNAHDDMHAGELEVSLLLHAAPELVQDGYRTGDVGAGPRPHLLIGGMAAYTDTGVIGRPSLGSAGKGRLILDSLAQSFKEHLALLTS